MFGTQYRWFLRQWYRATGLAQEIFSDQKNERLTIITSARWGHERREKLLGVFFYNLMLFAVYLYHFEDHEEDSA